MALISGSPSPATATKLTREQREELTRSVNEWPYPAAVLNREGACLLANSAYAEATGGRRPALDDRTPTPLAETVHPKDLPHARELLARVCQDNAAHCAKLRVHHVAGNFLTWWWEVSLDAATDLIVVRVAQPDDIAG